MTGLCHLPALRWISLLQVAPARVMTEEGKSVSRQITHLERLLCVCLQWMFFLEGNSCSISCRKRGLFIQFKWKEQNQEEWSVWEENSTWLCWNCRAWFENRLQPVFVVLDWERREREIPLLLWDPVDVSTSAFSPWDILGIQGPKADKEAWNWCPLIDLLLSKGELHCWVRLERVIQIFRLFSGRLGFDNH